MNIQVRSALTFLVLVVVLGVIGVATASLQFRSIDRRVDAQALETSHAIQLQVEQSLRRELELSSSVVASSPSFVGYVAQSLSGSGPAVPQIDTASIRDLLEERSSQFAFDIAGVLDVAGRSVVVAGDSIRGQPDFSAMPLVAEVRASGVAAISLWTHNDHLLLVSIAPMLRGTTVEAFLLSGYEIDSGFASRVSRTAQTGVSLVRVAANANTVVASTLPPAEHPSIVAAIDRQPLRPAVEATPTIALPRFDLALDGGATRATIAPLFGASETALLVSSIPLEQRLAIDEGIRQPMLLGGAAGVLLVLLCAWIQQRRVMKPLSDLSDLSERVLRGDFQLVAKARGTPATMRVGAAFNHMLSEVRAYKEAIEQRRMRD